MKKNLFALMLLMLMLFVSCDSAQAEGDSQTTSEDNTVVSDEAGDDEFEVSIGELEGLETIDTDGDTVTVDVFSDKDITLVNVWATWCPPCVAEMPYLAEIYKEMGDSVGVIGVVTDVTQTGAIDETVLGEALNIMTQSGVEFPVIYPDQSLIDAKLNDVQAIPTTFFVDSEGNIVGETYTGAREKEDWIEIINAELAAIGK